MGSKQYIVRAFSRSLPAGYCEFSVAWGTARKGCLDVFRCQFIDDINERTTGTNGRKLPGVTYKYVAFNISAGVEQGRELVFSEH